MQKTVSIGIPTTVPNGILIIAPTDTPIPTTTAQYVPTILTIDIKTTASTGIPSILSSETLIKGRG
jgi:hypothetical protein